jgi:signal transduction histidine kinase
MLTVSLTVLGAVSAVVGAHIARQRLDDSLDETSEGFVRELKEEKRLAPNAPLAVVYAGALEDFPLQDRQIAISDRESLFLNKAGVHFLDPHGVAAAVRSSGPGNRVLFTTATNVASLVRNVRVFVQPLQIFGTTIRLVIVRPTDDMDDFLLHLRRALGIAFVCLFILGAVGGAVLTRRSLAPVVAMTREASRMTALDKNHRLPVPEARGELQELAFGLNGLLDRLAISMDQQRRFLTDISHELRTPVSIIRGESEVAMSVEDRPAAEYLESLKIVNAEARHLSTLVDEIFLLARVDAGQYPVVFSPFYIDELIADVARSLRARAGDRQMQVNVVMPPGLMVRADERLIRRAITNLVENALKYSIEGTKVEVHGSVVGEQIHLQVRDHGPGIPLEAHERIFDRFYRLDRSRSSDTHGAGLGLAIARWIAMAHAGNLRLSNSSAKGSTFLLVLPTRPGTG